MEKIEWSVHRGYDVSLRGDKRFSPRFARLREGRTIEEAYQLDVNEDSKPGTNPKKGKGKKFLHSSSREQLWVWYLELWNEWARDNSDLLGYLLVEAKRHGWCLRDSFARDEINQARALAQILNDLYLSTDSLNNSKGTKI